MKHVVLLISLAIVVGTIWVVKFNIAPMMVTLLVLSFIGIVLQIPNIFKTKVVRQLNMSIFSSFAILAIMSIYRI